ncbi:MAG TPA: N-acetyl-gamma-glutamyl-phosphate reductase, partial [Spirochaetota bacterium]|nr:N-acetyl-gamma-glutamyl-phosphate reductase [Spirochaetota bacterium]
STAFRTDPSWAYGIPELKGQREKILRSNKIANPGCHATGFIMLLKPFIEKGILSKDMSFSATSLTGYSGAGKKMIERYQNKDFSEKLQPPAHYALTLNHKHLKEMQKITDLTYPPIFTPIISSYYQGMIVSIPVHRRELSSDLSLSDFHFILKDYYKDEKFVKVMDLDFDKYLEDGFLSPVKCNDTNNIELFVFGNEDRFLLSSRFDNLGKGASGAAVQNMNIVLGFDETAGLI